MLRLKRDPGPCPVDDCPHTTCVAPEGDSNGVIVSAPRPPRDGPRQPRSAPHIVTRTASDRAFTTATYESKKHNPRRPRKGEEEEGLTPAVTKTP